MSGFAAVTTAWSMASSPVGFEVSDFASMAPSQRLMMRGERPAQETLTPDPKAPETPQQREPRLRTSTGRCARSDHGGRRLRLFAVDS